MSPVTESLLRVTLPVSPIETLFDRTSNTASFSTVPLIPSVPVSPVNSILPPDITAPSAILNVEPSPTRISPPVIFPPLATLKIESSIFTVPSVIALPAFIVRSEPF